MNELNYSDKTQQTLFFVHDNRLDDEKKVDYLIEFSENHGVNDEYAQKQFQIHFPKIKMIISKKYPGYFRNFNVYSCGIDDYNYVVSSFKKYKNYLK